MTGRGEGTTIEKNIWILWLQGFDMAPDLVKVCSQSWVRQNPGWRVHLLSRESVVPFLADDFAQDLLNLKLTPQMLADLIRLHLITRHGGVWADADCYCALPLDSWLPRNMVGGFFAFRFEANDWLEANRSRSLARVIGRSTDRILSNWFLAGRAENPVSRVFLERHLALFKAGKFGDRPPRKGLLRLAVKLLKRNAYLSSKLASFRLLKALRAYPYFIFHYHFADVVLKDPAFDCAWRAVPKVTNADTLAYSKTLHLAADERFRRDMSGSGSAPMYKLHWHLQDGAGSQGSRYLALLDMQ